MEEPVPIQPPVASTQPPVVETSPQGQISLKKILMALVVGALVLAAGYLGYVLVKLMIRPGTPTATPEITEGSLTGVGDKFEGTILGGRWDIDEASGVTDFRVENGNLVLITPGGGKEETIGMVTLRTPLTGPFEASVEMELKEESDIGATTHFVFHEEAAGWVNIFGFYLTKEIRDDVAIRAFSVYQGQDKELAATRAPLGKKIKLAFTRTTNGILFSIDGQPFVNESEPFYTGDGKISLSVSSTGPPFPKVISNFDNFICSF